MSDQSEIVDLVLAESDKRIAAQIQVMLAADARSVGLLAASSTLAAAGLAVSASQISPSGNAALLVAAASFTAASVASSLTCAWALNPEHVNIVGWSPTLFEHDIKSGKSFDVIKAEMIALNQEKMDENARTNSKISRRVRIAVALLALAPVFAAGALCGAKIGGL